MRRIDHGSAGRLHLVPNRHASKVVLPRFGVNVTTSPGFAVFLAIGAGILFVGLNSVVKLLADGVDTIMLVWARYFFHVLFVLLLFPKTFLRLFGTPRPGVQFSRSVLLLVSTIMNFVALRFMSLGDVSAIIFTTPLMVAALAMIILHERVSVSRWIAILVGFGGTLMIVKPAGDVNVGALLALGCALAYSFYQISTRLVREAEPVLSLLYAGLVGMIMTSLILPWFWHEVSLTVFALMAATGVLGASAHLLMIMALQRAEVSRISPFTYLQLVWATLVSIWVFGDLPGIDTIVGAVLIIVSGLSVVMLDRRATRSERNHASS